MSSEFTARKTRRCLFLGSGDEKNAKTDSAEFWLTHLKPTPPPKFILAHPAGRIEICLFSCISTLLKDAGTNEFAACMFSEKLSERNEQTTPMDEESVCFLDNFVHL